MVRRPALAITVAVVVSLGIASLSPRAWAQGAARDQSGTLTAQPDDAKKSWVEKRFGGSFAELSTYIGSGTFYASGYRDPYVSNALYLRPSYNLGTKYKLTLNARVYLEEEYTLPDNPTGRRFNPLDVWFYLAAKNLYTEPRSKVKVSGVVRAVVPVSYESRYSHMVTGFALGATAARGFEFGKPDSQGKRWELMLSLGEVFTKYIRSSDLRGNFPGDTTGCRTFAQGGGAGGGVPGPGGTASGSEADRCGGPLNTSFANNVMLNAGVSRSRASLSVMFLVINEFRYSVPADTFSASNSVPTGRADSTWSIISLGYELTDHVGASIGISTFQPALNSRQDGLRFPFFDTSGANANNFTQAFVSLNGTL